MKPFLLSSALCIMAASPSLGATFFSNELQFQNAAGSLTEIDFQTDAGGQALSNGVVIDDEFLDLGISFGSTPGFPITNFFNADLATNGQGTYSGGNFIQLVPRTQGGGQLNIEFVDDIQFFSVWIGDIQDSAGVTTLTAAFSDSTTEAFNVNQVTGDAPFEFAFFGVAFDRGVERLTFDVSPADLVIFDDVSFEKADLASVPLPASFLFLFGAFAFLAGANRLRAGVD